jgi:hypothetical protein
VEKFVVLEGDAVIRFRKIGEEISSKFKVQSSKDEGESSKFRVQSSENGGQRAGIIEYRVKGEEFRVVDIPPGYTHSIENVGQNDLIVLFWADEIFNPDVPDTYFEKV